MTKAAIAVSNVKDYAMRLFYLFTNRFVLKRHLFRRRIYWRDVCDSTRLRFLESNLGRFPTFVKHKTATFPAALASVCRGCSRKYQRLIQPNSQQCLPQSQLKIIPTPATLITANTNLARPQNGGNHR